MAKSSSELPWFDSIFAKFCSRCGEWKARRDFHPVPDPQHRLTVDQREHHCTSCQTASIATSLSPPHAFEELFQKCPSDWLVLSPSDIALCRRLAQPPTPAPGSDPTAPYDALTLGATPAGEPVTMTDTDRTRHVYLIGGTGSGKSVTLTNLATQDIRAGRGFTVIDPHGDLAQGLLQRVPPEHFDRVTYFDPTDEDAPAFNLLAADFAPDKLTTDIVAAFKMFFGDSWGHQMEHLLRNALLTLLADRANETHSFADLRTLLTDADYRATIVQRAAADYAAFWRDEYPQLTKDAARPILTRLGAVLVPGSAIKRVVSSTRNDLDIRSIMDGGKILLVNLSKGALGDQPAKLLGGLIVTAITQAALARQRQPEKDRTPHTLYCDEFQNFADLPSTETILSEARKYQLQLVLAHQTMAQVEPRLMENILGNVRTVVGFNVSPHDAAKLAQRMARTRYVYPDTGEPYDLGKQRRAVAQIFLDRMHTFTNGTTAVPTVEPKARGQGFVAFVSYGRKGFERSSPHGEYNPAAISPKFSLQWLRAVADLDPTSYEPPQPTEFRWKTTTWPTAQDFQNLATCHAFLMRNVAVSTCELRVPFPPPVAHPDNLDHWHERRAREIAAAEAHEKKRRTEKPQEPRTRPETTEPPHQNATTFDGDAGDAVHSPAVEPPPNPHDDDPRPKLKQFPKPPRPA